MRNGKKILIISPHTDDGEIGCGGTISRFVREGCEIFYLALSHSFLQPDGHARSDLSGECKNALKVLGIKSYSILGFEARNFLRDRQMILDTFIQTKKEFNPNLIFVPISFDLHQDHQVVTEEARRAFRDCTILGYEMFGRKQGENFSFFIRLEKSDVEKKIKAFHQYKSQKFRRYYDPKVLTSLAMLRGLQIRCDYAEAFEPLLVIV